MSEYAGPATHRLLTDAQREGVCLACGCEIDPGRLHPSAAGGCPESPYCDRCETAQGRRWKRLGHMAGEIGSGIL